MNFIQDKMNRVSEIYLKLISSQRGEFTHLYGIIRDPKNTIEKLDEMLEWCERAYIKNELEGGN